MLTVHAPAKLNLVLEVLGRGCDYHRICSIAQTIDLYDILTFEPAPEIIFTTSESAISENNLVPRTAHLLRERFSIVDGARIHLEKRIPWAAGLGGGSSDAAATLQALNQMWSAGLSLEQLLALGAEMGSDVPLFLLGGTVLVEGEGEQVGALDTHPELHTVIMTPCSTGFSSKTARLYSLLRPEMFTMGQFVRAATFALEHRRRIPEDLLFNVFEKVAGGVFESLAGDYRALQEATGVRAHLAGSGPSVYALLDTEDAAHQAAMRLRRTGRRVFTARTTGPTAV